MTELETMQRAKMYMDKLAQGIDPITDSVLNHVRLVRCFFYVSDVLGKVIANGGTVGQIVKNVDFSITREQLATILWRYAKSKAINVSVGEDTNILSFYIE